MLPGSQPQTVAFILLAQLCDPKVNEAEIGTALFTKNGEGRSIGFVAGATFGFSKDVQVDTLYSKVALSCLLR